MSGGVHGSDGQLDREYLLVMGLLPAAVTVGAMVLTFSVVGGLLFVAEGLLLGSFWAQLLAVAAMYALPQFAVGVWMGARYGLSAAPPVAVGLAPMVVLVLALAVFGGPVLTPFRSPLLALGAVAAWSLLCACGLVVGANVLAPRLDRTGK